MYRLMYRSLAGMLLVFLLLPLAAAAQDPRTLAEDSVASQLQGELRLERRMLALDLVTYNEAREQDRRAQQAVNDVLTRLDTALAGDAVTLGTLEGLRNDLDAARATVRITEERLAGQIERIQERLRRIGLLEGETGTPARIADPITGRWRVTILPQNATATFDLRLERIDSHGGFDSVWEGTAGGGRMAGTWMSNELVTGQPTRGSWTAVREGQALE